MSFTCMSILRGELREVVAVDSEVWLRRPLGLRPFPFEVTVLAFVCLVLESMMEVISCVNLLPCLQAGYLVYPREEDLALAGLFLGQSRQ
jgi:hypothetical protein